MPDALQDFVPARSWERRVFDVFVINWLTLDWKTSDCHPRHHNFDLGVPVESWPHGGRYVLSARDVFSGSVIE